MHGRDAATGNKPNPHVTEITGKRPNIASRSCFDLPPARQRGDPHRPKSFGSGCACPRVMDCFGLGWRRGGAGPLVPGRVRAERRRPGVRHRERARRFRCREGVRRRGPRGIRRRHGIGAGFRRERVGFVHWRNCHGCPSAAGLVPVCGREFRIRPGRDRGQTSPSQSRFRLSPGSERPPKCRCGSIY